MMPLAPGANATLLQTISTNVGPNLCTAVASSAYTEQGQLARSLDGRWVTRRSTARVAVRAAARRFLSSGSSPSFWPRRLPRVPTTFAHSRSHLAFGCYNNSAGGSKPAFGSMVQLFTSGAMAFTYAPVYAGGCRAGHTPS
jgi:hypothetical protein